MPADQSFETAANRARSRGPSARVEDMTERLSRPGAGFLLLVDGLLASVLHAHTAGLARHRNCVVACVKCAPKPRTWFANGPYERFPDPIIPDEGHVRRVANREKRATRGIVVTVDAPVGQSSRVQARPPPCDSGAGGGPALPPTRPD